MVSSRPRFSTGSGLVLRHLWGGRFILLRHVGDQGFGGQDHGCDGGGIFEGATGHLGGINDTTLDHITIGFRQHIVTDVLAAGLLLSLAHVFDNNRAIFAGVFSDAAHRDFQGFADDVDTDLGIFAVHLEGIQERRLR